MVRAVILGLEAVARKRICQANGSSEGSARVWQLVAGGK